MSQPAEVVYLVDDDPRVREGLSELLASSGIDHVTFGAAAEYLSFDKRDTCACLILDLHLPDVNGLELQRQLNTGSSPPIIFISGNGDIPSTVRAIKAGAMEFLMKPVEPLALLSAIRGAFSEDRKQRQKRAELAELQRRFSSLTPREREALPLIAAGMLNKQAAASLGITEVTLQVHRGQIMRKMKADSFAELVRMAGKLSISTPDTAL